MSLTSVIVNYEGEAVLRDCVLSVLQRDVIVVDNPSEDSPSASQLIGDLDVKIITMAENVGFAAAANRGIEEALAAGADRVLLLNNDVTVCAGTIEQMERLDLSETGAIGGTLYYHAQPGVIQNTGVYLNRRTGLVYTLGDGAVDTGQFTSRRTVDWVLGGCCLIGEAALRDVGLFDERYFLFWEDADWAFRARRVGRLSQFVPGLSALHRGSWTTRRMGPQQTYLSTRNCYWFVRRYLLGFDRTWLLAYLTCYRVPRSVIGSLVRRRQDHSRALIRGALHGMRQRHD